MIKIGSDQTGHTGVLTCVTDLPGLVTLTASDPACVLTPSSFTVGGSVASYADAAGTNWGIGAKTDAIAYSINKRRNKGIGIDLEIKTGSKTSGGGTGAGLFLWAHVRTLSGGFMSGLMIDLATRKITCYINGAVSVGPFNYVVALDTLTPLVFAFENSQITLYTPTTTQTITHAAIGDDIRYDSVTDSQFALHGQYRPMRVHRLQCMDAVPSAGEAAAYIAGGDLSATLKCKINFDEESGDTAYDQSGNLNDFGVETYNATTFYSQVLNVAFPHVVTGLTGNEQSIAYDTTTLAPGAAVTITATRTKAGFPTGRTPDISVESDTCTVTAAAAPGLSVVGVALDEHAISLDIGGTHQLHETVFPSTATTKTVTWASSNTAVATVAAGLVTRVSGGTAVITVTTVDGGFTDTVDVTCAYDLTGTTPQAAKAWVVSTIKALRPTIRPNEHYDEYPKLLEGGDLPPGRSRIFALEEISADASRMVFGARMYGLRLYIGYLTQTTAKASGQVNSDIMASDIDYIKRMLEYRESWDTHIISVLCGQSVISGNDSGKGLAITVTDIEIHYLPIGV